MDNLSVYSVNLTRSDDKMRSFLFIGSLKSLLTFYFGDSVVKCLAKQVVIHRDEWGVLHIRGESDTVVVFGSAWARVTISGSLNTYIRLGVELL